MHNWLVAARFIESSRRIAKPREVRARVLQTCSLIDFTRFLDNVPKSVLRKAAHVLLCRLSSIFVLKKETKHVIFGQSQNCPFLEIGMQYYFCNV